MPLSPDVSRRTLLGGAAGAAEFTVPAGARTVTLRFRMYDAGNNWYWAVDHIRLG
ncbi:hypothetical protein [Streptomyces sp. NPDC026092]|uniref:hypothetical protein n=1 Tax=Streptomyces sp. NPDC026092 TaxID=3154797 RepID=UPI0033F4E96C